MSAQSSWDEGKAELLLQETSVREGQRGGRKRPRYKGLCKSCEGLSLYTENRG